MKKICIIGHYGANKEYIDGQTIKTKTLTKKLIKTYGINEVMRVDTYGGIGNIWIIIKKSIIGFQRYKNIIMMPAKNGLKILAPLLFFLNIIYSRKIHYVVIGGWLPEFLKGKKLLKFTLSKFDFIYVETEIMKKKLELLGFNNIVVMPNFKKLNIISKDKLIVENKENYNLCTFSRVMKEKGIESAIEAVILINAKYGFDLITLDIFGQIDPNQRKWFDQVREKFPPCIKYKGIVPFEKTTEVLSNYYALLFPTFYEGEGFAGTLIDAMAAGVPVIASDWKYNSEIIKNNYTGYIYSIEDKKLQDTIEYAIINEKKWQSMRINCINESLKYTPDNVIRILINYLL